MQNQICDHEFFFNNSTNNTFSNLNYETGMRKIIINIILLITATQ